MCTSVWEEKNYEKLLMIPKEYFNNWNNAS